MSETRLESVADVNYVLGTYGTPLVGSCKCRVILCLTDVKHLIYNFADINWPKYHRPHWQSYLLYEMRGEELEYNQVTSLYCHDRYALARLVDMGSMLLLSCPRLGHKRAQPHATVPCHYK